MSQPYRTPDLICRGFAQQSMQRRHSVLTERGREVFASFMPISLQLRHHRADDQLNYSIQPRQILDEWSGPRMSAIESLKALSNIDCGDPKLLVLEPPF
jgi:hypothetical protein